MGRQEFFYMLQNLTTWDLPALLPIREEGVLRIFIALKNPSPWPGFEPETLVSSDQHTNHYTTKATGSGRGLILTYYTDSRPEGLGKTTESLGQDSLSPGRNLNTVHPVKEVGVFKLTYVSITSRKIV
jgi:hypothetical protein